MRYRILLLSSLIGMGLHTAVVHGNDPTLPERDGRRIVAVVNDGSISLDELVLELDPGLDHTRLREGYGSAGELELLDRLVNIRLVVQESEAMGLREQPEIRKQVEVASRAILRDVLLERVVKDVTADPAAVEAKYTELTRQWKTASLLFHDQAAAAEAHKALAGGAAFADVAARATAAKTARADGDEQYHAQTDYLPAVAAAIATLSAGQVSPVIPIQAGFAVIEVIDIRNVDDAGARTRAEQLVLAHQREAAMRAHEEALRHELVVVHQDVLDSVVYEAETPGLAALRADTRILADIKGAASVSVGDLTQYLELQSFHGDQVGERKRMTATRQDALDAMIGRRLLNAEAAGLGLDKTHEYLDRVSAFEASLVFNTFIQKVIVPDSKLTEDEVQRYYADHLKDYSSPEMVKMQGLAFADRPAAESAMARLREGADFGWLAANADGQAPRDAKGLLAFDGRPVTTDSMPPGLQQAITAARAGEYRLYAAPENGPFYVLEIQEVITPTPKAYDEVRQDIARKVYGEKLRANTEAYLARLRAASHIEIFLEKAE
jgi:parvulin-like peptidyl-prolyl isomerase